MRRIFASILLAMMLASCVEDNNIDIVDMIKAPGTSLDLEASQDIKKFASKDELIEFLKERQTTGYAVSYGGWAGRDMIMTVAEESVGGSKGAPAPMMDGDSARSVSGTSGEGASGNGASDYSQTNVQVAGVDEADFVKNDDKYIYIIADGELVIVDAFPAESAKKISETDIDGTPQELFINGDRAVVFAEENDEVMGFEQYDIIPRPRYTTVVHAYVYDITDREEPKLVRDYKIEGTYFQSRMIGDDVYFITKEYVYYYDNYVGIPEVRNMDKTILRPDIYYFDNPETDYVFHTVAGFDLASEEIDAKTFLMGYSNTIYVSEDNMYITYEKNMPYDSYRIHERQRFIDVILPLFPDGMQVEIRAIMDEDLPAHEEWDQISAALEEGYNRMDEDSKEELFEKIQDEVADYEAQYEKERRKTVIHKLGIADAKVGYEERGEVPGRLLNQFSLDEHDGNLRVATTLEFWTRDSSYQANNVYVLDEELEIIGKLEDLAEDERIYSTRFIGDRLYMVTFKRIDPLFVIDLSDPEKPSVLGELKIPGFSDYLHPYDEDHIIGIGKETGDNEWGGVSIKGVKVALFDVSDVAEPKQLDQYIIGEAGTDSEALRDHKAFLFDRKKDLLVIPVREVKGKETYDSRRGYYTQRVLQGDNVLGLTPEDAI